MMGIFSAHFDESGTLDVDNRVLTVAGCVSDIKKWARFEHEWNAVLQKAGLPEGIIFHTNRFARNLPPYESFAGDSTRKAALLAALVACVKRNVNKAFSCSVGLRDWERVNERYCIAEHLGYPYSFCGATCVSQVLKWARKNDHPAIEFYFEDGATHRGKLKTFLKQQWGIEAEFRSKKKMIQFQAADLLAWKSRKVLSEVVEYDGPADTDAYHDIQRSLSGIKSIPHAYGVHVRESLERLAIGAGVPRRS